MNQKVYLVLSPTPSSNSGDHGKRAIEFSRDKEKWESIPQSIHVYGSEYALVCNSLIKVDFTLDLNRYEVAVGGNKGKALSDYIAEIIDPYAVFVRYKNRD